MRSRYPARTALWRSYAVSGMGIGCFYAVLTEGDVLYWLRHSLRNAR